MKKLFVFLAVAAMAVSASAQGTATIGNKFGDNWYIGVNGGVGTATTHNRWLKNLMPNAGLRIGKNLTTVFGLALEGNVYFAAKDENAYNPYPDNWADWNGWGSSNWIPDWNSQKRADGKFVKGTVVKEVNVNLLGTFNLMNLFAGYQGTPRPFEISALVGLGWGHPFAPDTWEQSGYQKRMEVNFMTSKLALDFAFNMGEKKNWQIYVEPSINYALVAGGKDWGVDAYTGFYNLNKSMVQLNAGVIYKFKTSNGTHNFVKAALRDQSEIDGLNDKINSLRNELAGKDQLIAGLNKQIADLKNQLANQKPVVVNNIKEGNILQPSVIYRVAKSNIDPSQMAQVEMVAKYMKNHPNCRILVEGYASPEGNPEKNQKLSEARAEAVKTALIKKYKVAADRIDTKGMGVTDKLFDEYDFNRVAIFKDLTK